MTINSFPISTVDLGTLGPSIKTAYEAEPDTNAFTDADKAALAAAAPAYPSRAAAEAADTGVAVGGVIHVRGFAAEGDGGDGFWVRLSAAPGHGATFTDAGGAVFGPCGPVIRAEQVGARADISENDSSGIAANTAAIQAAINAAAETRKRIVQFGQGVFRFNRLFLHYDAADNPTFPQALNRQGRITLAGVGRPAHDSLDPADTFGTVLLSSDPVGPALYAQGETTLGTAYRAWLVQIRDLGIWADNSAEVILFDRVAQGSGFDGVLVHQANLSGGGVRWEELWMCYVRELYVRGPGAGSTGVGFVARNLGGELTGGFLHMVLLTADRFGAGILLGHESFGAGNRLHSAVMENCQAISCPTGIEFGHAINQIHCSGCHVEGADIGLLLRNNPREVVWTAGSFVNNVVGVQLGTGANNSEDRYGFVTIDHSQFDSNAASTDHVKIFAYSESGKVTLAHNRHIGDASAGDTCVNIEDSDDAWVEIRDCHFSPNASVAVNRPERARVLIDGATTVRRSVVGTGALPGAPHVLRADSADGGAPVLEVFQRDNDIPFLRFGSAITPGDNANHISTTNAGGSPTGPSAASWSFRRMVKVQLQTAAGTEDLWLPLFARL